MQGASAIDDDSKEELQLDNHSFNMITENSSVQGSCPHSHPFILNAFFVT
jgi:hypothetical protein